LRVELPHRVDHAAAVDVGGGGDVGVPHEVFCTPSGVPMAFNHER
jgi:hypothetical protein